MNILISYFSGLVASFTPCIIVLIPILMYKFISEGKIEYKKFFLFLGGYIFFYILFGYFLKNTLTSQIQNGFKFGLGLLFIILGILSIFNKLNPIKIPIFNNPYLLGISFALIVSFNPCSLPYLSIIFSETGSKIFYNLIFFALGLITPAFIFSFFGISFLNISKKTQKITSKINTLMHYILILSGFYIIFTIKSFSDYDIYLVGVFFIFIFLILLKSYFIINSKKDLFKLKNVLLLLSLIIIVFTAVTHCAYQVKSYDNSKVLFGNLNNNKQQFSCSSNVFECKICTTCIYKFLFASFLGFLAIVLTKFNYINFFNKYINLLIFKKIKKSKKRK